MKHSTHLKITVAGLGLALATSAQAAITAVGGTSDYTFQSADWHTRTASDIDANGLGTDGSFFFGIEFDAGGSFNNEPFTRNTTVLPAYVTGVAAGADFLSVADNTSTSLIDNPDDLTRVLGLDFNSGASVSRNGSDLPAGNFVDDALQVTIGTLAAGQTVRLGFLVNNEGTPDGRWDATSFTITDGTNSVTFGDHVTSPLGITTSAAADTAWILVDIDTAGTYTIGGTKRLAGNQGISLGGVTFDSVTIPEPSTSLLAGLAAISLAFRRRK